jgi:uroporphyrin-3 C-methyltransferase
MAHQDPTPGTSSTPGRTRIPLIAGSTTIAVSTRPYLAYLLALLALCLAAYAWKTTRDAAAVTRHEQASIAKLEASVSATQRQQQRLMDDLNLKSHQLDVLNTKLTNGDGLNGEQRRLWLFHEADFYLRLAQQHLTLSHDPVGTRRLLDVADHLLATQGDNRALPLRAAIAKDRLMLASVQPIDITGIYLRLTALSERIGALQLGASPSNTRAHTVTTANPAATTTTPAAASSLLDVGWAKLRSLVLVSHYDAPIQPLLNPADRRLLQDTLQLDITHAQLALMQGNAAIYKNSLTHAHSEFARYFPPLPATEYNSLQQELAALSTVALQTTEPDLSASLHALSALSAQLTEAAP